MFISSFLDGDDVAGSVESKRCGRNGGMVEPKMVCDRDFHIRGAS